MDRNRLPEHIAIIMDGNGRWAKQHAMGRIRGHQKGAQAVRKTTTACRELHIPYLTLFAFSSENWGRPDQEVTGLMRLLEEYLDKESTNLHKQGISLNTIGDLTKLPRQIHEKILQLQDLTKENREMVLTLALSYGSRDEMVNAVGKIVSTCLSGKMNPADITKETFSRYLYTANIPDPDLLIRTSGEYRISNFLLWQLAYTELYFTETLWPDFKKKDLQLAIEAYQSRERRFGLTGEQMNGS